MTSAATGGTQLPTPPSTYDGNYNLQTIALNNAGMSSGYPPRYAPPPGHFDDSMYGDPVPHQTAQAGYYPAQQPSYRHEMHTPPTVYDNLMTRDGQPLGTPMPTSYHDDRERFSNSPGPRKRARKQKAKAAGPELAAPLSELTKDYTVPIKDMEAWVNRPQDVRMKDAKKNNKIPRPMNSFMLYRSAYAERVKKYCDENNHQVVSQVTGQSWPMEPKDVRDFYDRLALTEKENHMKAHPNYKFAPNKNANTKKRRWGESDNESDVDDPDWRSSRGGTPKRQRSEHPSRRSTPYEARQPAHPVYRQQPTSIPQYMTPAESFDQYYQPPLEPYAHSLEAVSMRRTAPPGNSIGMGAPLTGLPRGDHHDLLNSRSEMSTPGHDEIQVDPNLAYTSAQHATMVPGQVYPPASNYQYYPESGATGSGYQWPAVTEYAHPGSQTLTEQGAWLDYETSFPTFGA